MSHLRALSITTLFITTLFILVNGVNQAQAATKLDVNAFTQLPQTIQVEVSPDAKHIATIFKRDGKYMLFIMRASDLEIVKIIDVQHGHSEISKLYWANSSRLLYQTITKQPFDKTMQRTGELFGVNLDGNKHKALMGYRTERLSESTAGHFGFHEIIDLMPEDERHILVAFYPWRLGASYYLLSYEAKPIIYRLNVYTTQLKRLTFLPMPLANAINDNNNQIRISYIGDDNGKLTVHHKGSNEDKWVEFNFTGLPKARRIEPISFAADNNRLYVKADQNKGPESLYLYDLTTHKAEKVYQHATVDIRQLVYNHKQDEIIALSTEHGRPQYHIFNHDDPISQAHKQLLKLLQGYNIKITSWSESQQQAIVFVHADYDPGHYYLYNHKTGDLQHILSANPDIDADQMASKEPIEIKSRDGITLHGYLTRPTSKSQSLPTVVLVHKGPHSQKDSWSFDWQSQLLAYHGYAVLQLNYRGSSGYGYGFEKMGYGQWGAAMQNDLTDATLQLIEQGIADKNRICIMGQNYGGYAALMGVVREPNLYQCAIGSMGIYSLPELFEKHYYTISAQRLSYLNKVLGKNKTQIKQYSPAFNADKITAPLLLIHGATDKRAPLKHLKLLENSLKANNKTYQKLILDNEGHEINDVGNRLKVYTEILKFLDQHIGHKK